MSQPEGSTDARPGGTSAGETEGAESPEETAAAEAPVTPQAARQERPGPTAELQVQGSTNFGGQFRGRGQLTLFLSDAARARIALDYRNPDNILLSVDSTAGIRLSADDSLTLSGGLTQNLVNQEIRGKVGASLRLSRDLAAQIEQEFGAAGPRTSVSVRVRL